MFTIEKPASFRIDIRKRYLNSAISTKKNKNRLICQLLTNIRLCFQITLFTSEF